MSELAQTDYEGIDSVRMIWNVWPRTKVEASKCAIPITTSISPICSHPNVPSLPYAPLRCKTYVAVLNPFACVDFTVLIWICPFYFQCNPFPHHYSAISETNLPAELDPHFHRILSSRPPRLIIAAPSVSSFRRQRRSRLSNSRVADVRDGIL
ncbi:hypothetical protein U1Q18_025892 [Sarracenia purpurea var. burkii]